MERIIVACGDLSMAQTKGKQIKCETCAKDVWISNTSIEMIEGKGGTEKDIEPMCIECVETQLKENGDKHTILPLSNNQRNEIHNMILKESGQQN